jgi:hypothetical protein
LRWRWPASHPAWRSQAFTNIKASGDITAGDDLIATDDATVGDDLTVTDDATVGDDLTTKDFLPVKQTAVVVTNGATITPTGLYQPISSTAATGTSSVAGVASGRMLILVNVGSQTITLTDTGTLKLSGNAALGAGDVLGLMSDGTNWNQLFKADN